MDIMNSRVDEDAIDLQDLQAQIDLSMSFAQNLVTSWIKPTHYSQTNRQKDLEDEIKEYLRRPGRLGVGTPVPETHSLAREAARLKSQLESGKKRHREDEGAREKRPESADEGESRASAIKKKARVDPFDVSAKKGKKKTPELDGKSGPTMHPAAMKAMSNDWVEMEDGSDLDAVAKGLLFAPESPEMLERASQNAQSKPTFPEGQGTKQPQFTLSSGVETIVDRAPSSKLPARSEPQKHPQPSSAGASLPSRQSPTASPAVHPKLDVSLTSLFLSIQPRARVSSLKQPLLNLHGSPSEGENDEDENPGPSGPTPKKKRKRRKKKKSQQHTESTSVQV